MPLTATGFLRSLGSGYTLAPAAEATLQPDLDVSNTPSLSSSSVANGGTFTFYYDVHNYGTGAAGPSTAGIYLSTDSTITTSDTLLVTSPQGAIAAGSWSYTGHTFALPGTLAAGNYYIGAIADYNNAIAESNETNNPSVGVAISVTAPSQPDLDVYYTPTLSVSSVAKGGSVTIYYDVNNLGTGAAGSSTSGIYLSSDSTITTSDTLLTTDAVASIAAGSWYSETASITISSTLAAGTYYIGAIADYNNAIAESNETNNPSVGVAISVTAPSQPDLDAYSTPSLSSSSVVKGGTVTLFYDVVNWGNGAAGSSVSGIYLSTDSTITTSDTLLTTDAVASIASGFLGVSSSESVSITLPSTLATGTYYIGAIADYNNAIAESNETNNPSSGVAISVTAPSQPDLDVYYTPSLGSSTVAKGGTVSFFYDVDNLGAGAAGSSVSGIYLSTDSTITISDTLLATDAVTSIAAGSWSWESASVTIPSTLATGTYFIGAIADYNDAVAESNETNNPSVGVAVSVVAQMLPDLDVYYTPSLLSTSVVQGGTDTLYYAVDNLGTGAAGASVSGIYLSTDSTITTSDTLLTTDAVDSITAGSRSSESVSITIPSTLATGTYYIGAIADYDNAISESNETNNPSVGVALSVTVGGQADLDVYYTPVLSSSSVVKGGTVTLYYNVNNFGTGLAGASTSAVYLSTDSTITSSDTLLTTKSEGSLSPNYWYSEIASITIPSTLATGTYYIGAIADCENAVAESNETNNPSSGVAISVTAPSQPDLDVYYAPSLSSSSVAKGGTVTLYYDVDNLGAAAAGSSTSGIYLSTDSTITTSDTLLTTDAVASIAANWWSSEIVSITIPSTLATGTYYIGAIADYNNAVAESNETNNPSSGAAISVTAPSQPDLDVYYTPSLSSSSVAKSGTVTIYYDVDNRGSGAAGSSTSGIYLSTDSTITTSDTLLTTDAVASIAANWWSSESASLAIPSTLATGTYYIGAIADYNNAVAESNETNNPSVGVAISVTAAGQPDLDVYYTPILSSSSVVKGGTVTLYYDVDNLGMVAAGSSTSGIYISTDSTITTSDTLLTTDAVASIAAGSWSSESASITIPSTLDTGTYYIGAIADNNNAVTESNETNNPSGGVWISVTAAGQPDLDVYYTPGLSSTSVAKGGTVTLYYDVDNLGTGAAGASSTGIYLSTDSTITTSDTLLTTDAVGSIAAGWWSSESASIAISSTLATGTYYIGAIADYNNAVAESNETNNPSVGVAISVTAAGQPDLDVYYTPSLSSSTVAKGGTVTLYYDVDNLSNYAAGASTTGIYLSTDSTITTSDTLLTTDAVASIAAHYWSSESASITIPGTLAAGTYYIGAIADYSNAVAESNETNNPSSGVAISVTGAGQPDLDVYFTPTLSSSAVAKGGTVTLYYDVDNLANYAAGASTTGIYLSTDSTITTSDTLLTTDAVVSIAAYGWSSESVSLAIPGTLATGTWYIGAIADYNNAVAESNEINNPSSGVAVSVTAPNQPDLDVYFTPTLSNSSVAKGGNVTLYYDVDNLGSGTAGASSTGIYLSTDSTITTSDTLLTTDAVASIAAGWWSSESASIAIPGTLAAGTYYIGAIADYNNAVAESNETNNPSVGVAIGVTGASQPDLDVYYTPSLSSSTVAKGGTVTLYYDVDNLANYAAGASTTGIYLSTDSTITTSDTLLTTDAVASIAAHYWSSESASIAIPSTLAAGTYYIGAIADYSNAVAESNETNNPSVGVAISVSASSQSDLDVYYTPVLASTSVAKGGTVTLYYDVDNLGSGAAGASTTGIYLSTDSTITTSDTLLTTDAVASIAAGWWSSESVSIAIPGTLATGTYYIGAIADYNNAVAESNETNNPSAGVAITITGSDDYAASTSTTGSVSIGGSATGMIETSGDNDWFRVSLTAGQSYEFHLNATSSGGLGDPYLNLYNSSGTLLTSNDDGGGSLNSLISFTATTSGNYYLGARAYSSGTGSYVVTATSSSTTSDDYAGSASTTGHVSVGEPATGRIEVSGDEDWFAISLTAGKTYSFHLDAASSGGLNDPYLNLYNGSGTLLSSNDDGGGNANSLITYTATSGGTYYLGVRAYGTGTGNYVVSATASSTTSDDYGDNASTTGRVSAGESTPGRIETNGDQDWFAISLTAGQVYTFHLDAASSGGLSDPYLSLYNSSGNLLTSDDDGGGSGNALISYTATTSGTYYLGARAYSSGTGDYVVSANTVTTTPTPTPTPSGAYHIAINYSGNSAYQSVFEAAAAKWEQVITQDLPDVNSSSYGSIDDLLINASVVSIDGVGQILGQAAPDAFRTGSLLPYHGFMQFDTADVQAMYERGTLLAVIEHEMGHVLGLGTLWNSLHLKNGNYQYVGSNALDAYVSLGGSPATSVPLEQNGGAGTAGCHWSESVFNTELMTGYIEDSGTMPLSIVTIAALEDLGYTVDFSAADAYTLPGHSVATSDFAQTHASSSSASSSLVAANSSAAPAAAAVTNFSGVHQVHYEDTPFAVDVQDAPIALNGPITTFTDSSIYFFELTTGNNYLVRIQGSFEKNGATEAKDIKGSVESISFYKGSEMVDSIDYGQAHSISADTLQSWHKYQLEGNNYFESQSVSSQDDVCMGLGGDDVFSLGGGSDTIDGGAGLDTSVYSGNRSAYTITKTASGYTVSGADGSDTLSGIERLQFANKNIAFDLDSGGAAGNTVKLIGAAFDTSYLTPDLVGIGIGLFDGGQTMQQVCELAIGTDLFRSIAGSSSNVDFVNTVYRNVVGELPSTADRDYYVGMLQGSGGTMTQAQLLEAAADAEVNAQNINLVGLQQTGVEYL